MIHADRMPANAHKGRFNAPSANEVALMIVGQQFQQRDIILESRNAKQQRISELHRAYDALQYPLMFCYGEDGYSVDVLQQDTADKLGPTTKLPVKKTVSAAQFYSWRIMLRDTEENYLLRYCALLSQFLVDEYAKIETEKLNFLKYNQSKLRSEEYFHLRDEVGRYDADQIGQRVVLPSSFIGGPRYMHERAQDAMSYVRHYGSSDLFITFTCNPKWKEIQREWYPGQKHYQRHDIIARVFHLKVKEFMDLIVKGQVFGKVRCHMLSVEWQKRGLPHIHCLLWLEEAITADMIDKVVCAEIPDVDRDPLLYDIVKANMIHGPCGSVNTFSPCMKDGCCTKRYPRPFVQETQRGQDGYPLYRRRTPEDGGFTVNLKGFQLDNRWVVPYNPVLLRTFESHINVEITNSVKSIKYVCKYITKGNDQAAFILKNDKDIDEIEIYESGRYISSSEAVWKILGFPIHERYPAVIHLALHLENGQRVYFTAHNIHNKVAKPPETTLSAFFNLCKIDEFARTLLLWEKYKDSFSEDIQFQHERQLQDSALSTKDKAYNQCLILIEDTVQTLGGQRLMDYGLHQPERFETNLQNKEYTRETNFDREDLKKKVHNAEASLTGEQSSVYQKILNSLESGTGQIFFLDSPSGTGKTFLLNLLLSKVRSNKGIALATASSGIAATLLEGGKTAHSAFRLPLNLNYSENPTCNIKKQSNLAKVLRDCKLIIWDESTMAHKAGFEALNATLKDLRNSDEVMGGVTVLLAGDFRQTLPVVPRGTRANEVNACIKSSHLWPKVQKLCLSKNMRVHLHGDASAGLFSNLLLKIGDGLYPECAGKIIIPDALATVVTELPDLIAKIYPDVADMKNKPIEWLCERAILSPKNDTAAEVNSILLKSFSGEDIYYKSFDTTTNRDDAVQYPKEFLNTLDPPGFPPHLLHLKVGTPTGEFQQGRNCSRWM
ncbi:uncharacterized protein LOC129225044 [Uloborus diversus]|uniref:uncharacterized protein LOC129225044 n=1 Tax=Uloborus diversus TaxID=327109 RepID=UPI0024099927|nr:uncharacterized protein LOC129225044 [Uloborus diversus]